MTCLGSKVQRQRGFSLLRHVQVQLEVLNKIKKSEKCNCMSQMSFKEKNSASINESDRLMGRAGAGRFPAHRRIKQKVFVRVRKHCCEPRA